MRIIEDDLKWFEHCIETNNGFAKDEARLAIKDIKDLLAEVNKLTKAQLISKSYVCGEWVNNHCSLCGKTPFDDTFWERFDIEAPKYGWIMSYCPCCGAKMNPDPDKPKFPQPEVLGQYPRKNFKLFFNDNNNTAGRSELTESESSSNDSQLFEYLDEWRLK